MLYYHQMGLNIGMLLVRNGPQRFSMMFGRGGVLELETAYGGLRMVKGL